MIKLSNWPMHRRCDATLKNFGLLYDLFKFFPFIFFISSCVCYFIKLIDNWNVPKVLKSVIFGKLILYYLG